LASWAGWTPTQAWSSSAAIRSKANLSPAVCWSSPRARAAIINAEADPVVAVGAIIAEIPMVDQVDVACIHTGDWVQVRGGEITITRGETR
jgi:hypothetical protein